MIKFTKTLIKNEGYTYINIFFLLLLMSLVSTIIYTNSTKITLYISKSKKRLNLNYDIIKLKLLLDDQCQLIKTPYCFKDHVVNYNIDTINIFYYNGNKDEYLTLEASNNGVFIYSNGNNLFSSTILKGSFHSYSSYIIYTFGTLEFIFPMGVFLA